MTQPKTTAAKTSRASAKATSAKPSAKDTISKDVASKDVISKDAASKETISKDIIALRTKVADTAARADASGKKGAATAMPLRQPAAVKPAQPDAEQVVEPSVAAAPARTSSVAAAVKSPTVASAPVKPSPAVPKAVQPVAAKAPAKASGQRNGFRTGEFVVYPAHGVGQIVAIEEQEVAGFKLELFVVSFMKDKMTLRVPTSKVTSVGLRKLADTDVMQRALDTLTGRARIKRTMWSRRAQEYEAKINSGDIVAIGEVVRDLYRSDAQPEQSYSERQLYEAALDRMAREIAAVQKLTESEALKLIDTQLQRGPRRGPKTEDDAVAEGDADGEIEEAA